MTQDELKALVAQAATAYVQPGSVIGVGTGSTVNHFIDALARMQPGVAATVSSSAQGGQRLRAHGICVLDANEVAPLAVYVDGADEIDAQGHMIKGGGGALTREKVVADLSERFICIADESKRVARLGAFGLPVEVIPMAAALECRINQWPGVVTVGLFARNKASICLLGTAQGVQTLHYDQKRVTFGL